VGERGWKIVDRLVEVVAKTEVSERRRKVVHMLVEFISQIKESEGRRAEGVEVVVEQPSKDEVGERTWKGWEWEGKWGGEFEPLEGGRECVDGEVEGRRDN
jgi:hypothetical protein